MSLSLSHAQTCTGCGQGTRHPATRQNAPSHESCPCTAMLSACQTPFNPSRCPCVSLFLRSSLHRCPCLAWRGWPAPTSKEELNMTECWQCNHVDHKAVQGRAGQGRYPKTDGASKRRQATGCNVILQLVCSSAATCGIWVAANSRIWLHTTKDQCQTQGGDGRKQCLP